MDDDDFTRHKEELLKKQESKEEYERFDLRKKIIKEIIKLRNTYNLTQKQLAQKIGTTQTVISRIENGNVNVGIDFLNRLARAFNKKIEIRII